MKLVLSIVFTALIGFSFGQKFNLDLSKATVSFYFHGEKVNGSVAGLKASININKEKPELSEISGTVDVNTLDTGNKMRDKHLKSSDYFHADKFPTMSFKAKSIVKDGEGYSVAGIIKIKDVEREEKFVLTISKGVLTFKGSINSADYGIMKKKKREDSQVDITIEIPFL
jgi:polyisoprenoid-binding protein YceI